MEKIALALLVLIAVVALVGMLNLDSNTGMFMTRGNVVISGSIYDEDGYVLYTNKQSRYQRLIGSVVAVAPDGRIAGSGPVSPGQYSLTLTGDWRDYDFLTLQVGFYDAARLERNSLTDCTTISTAELLARPGMRHGKLNMDLYCNMETMQKPSTMRYR